MPNFRIRHRCYAIVLTIASLSVSAKTVRQYVHAQWLDPLPSANVLSLAQTRDGYLWIGTSAGLARFNGNDFVVFDTHNTPLQSDAISALLAASDGTLWIGTAGGGLYRMSSGVIKRIAQSAVSGTIRALAEDREHTIWAGVDRGVVRLSMDGARNLTLPRGAPQTAVNAICPIGDFVWFAKDGEGLSLFTGQIFMDYSTAEGLSSNAVLSLAAARDGRLLIGTERGGLATYKPARFGNIQAVPAKSSLFAMAEDGDGSLWISAEKGLCHLAGDNLDCAPLTEGGKPDVARTMLVDREGSLWLGGTISGLHRITNGKITSTTSESESDSIRSVTESVDGTIWGGGEGVGVQFLRDGILVGDGRNARLPSLYVRSVLADRDGSLWVGSIGGLTHLSGATTTTYPANVVDALAQDGDGSLWIGTTTGLNHFNGETMTSIPSETPIDVRAVHRDRKGQLRIGTRNGLHCLVNDRVGPCGDGVLRDTSIFAFHEDADALWIGTNRGLARMRGTHTTLYTTRDGLLDDTVFAILEDEIGNLWMSSGKGISRARRSDFDAYDRHAIPSIPSESFDKSDGMAATQCNGATQPAAWKSRDGRLWFPTANGLAIVDPRRLPRNTLAPLVVIEQFLVNGKPAPAARSSLPPETHSLEIHYAALSFVAPEKVHYRYKLEGFDPDWIDVRTRRVAIYTNVPAGSYRFRVIATNNDGVWNTTGDSLAMGIAPFYYETLWFRALIVIAFITILTILYRLRLWQLRRNERRLTALVAEQTVALRKANAALEELAAIDPLTQLANRRSLDAALARMWAEHSRTGTSLAAILCDIDHFKKYNDSYGHQAGDETLIRVARALASSIPRSTDIAARFGGEEFVILLGHCTLDEATLVADRVLASVRSLAIEHRASTTAPHVTVSLGVAAIVPDSSSAPEGLVRTADEALYRAKEGGRDRFAVARR